MSSQTEADRWGAGGGHFARQIQIADMSGFLSKKLSIEPGSRALIVEEGQYLGEVPPGTYTMESLTQRLRPWRRKQATAVLVRQEEVPLEISCENLPTSESLLVGVDVRLSVQIDDVAMFLRNLLGARETFSCQELHDALEPLVRQALWETIGRLSITDLTGLDVRRNLDAGIEQALSLAMRRYGLRFGQVQAASIRHQRYDEHRQKAGEAWLAKEETEQRKGLDEIYSAEQLRQIKLQEKTNELEILAQQVAGDRMEGELAVRIRRVGLRDRLRETILSDRFNKIKSEEDLARMVQEQDKANLLRTHEMDELAALYRDKKDDRESARQHLVRKLDLERSMELEQVRVDLSLAVKRKTLEHEIEVARRVEVEENRRWVESLERQRREAEHHRQEQDKDLEKQRQWASQSAVQRRDDEWQDWLHKQRLDRVQGEVEVTQLERRTRTDQLKAEIDRARQKEELEAKRRQTDLEQELGARVFQSQIEKLDAIARLNEQRARFELDLLQRKQRLDAEISELAEDKVAQRDLARIQAMRDMGAEQLIAAADVEKGKLLADLKKHEASEKTRQTLGAENVAAADAAIAEREHARIEQQRLLKKLSETERAQADAVAQAFREALVVRQQIAQEAILAMRPTVGPNADAASQAPAGPGQPAAQRAVVCPQCRAENDAAARHCSGCGTKF